ncbi:MAG: FtsX-like permease family protein [Peptoniphilus sp.]|nr:FtsX-like permease family protein [Peptoniphilus sp.]MDD7362667.1 FtsX-like permease family protein [Bacillota bacterium]MDY6044934.1 FtsX-like permease family protein [Peptoniphilus sp.]
MKSYLSLIPLSAKARRHQNRLTIACIAIAVFLVTTIFSMADMAIRMEMSRLQVKHAGLTMGDLYSSAWARTLLSIALALFILILVAGVLMISGSLNNSVAERTQFFGMMRCIGMSREQVMTFVKLEALNWSKIAIPIGVSIGIVVTWALCAGLRYMVGEEFLGIPLFGVSATGIAAGGLMGLMAVLAAAVKPAKQAANISPIAAASGNIETVERRSAVECGNDLNIETRLGMNHALAGKKNIFRLTGSFALSIILFFTLSVFVDFVNYLMPQSHAAADIDIVSEDSLNSIDSNRLKELAKVHGIKNVYGRRAAFDVEAEMGPSSSNVDVVSFDDFDLSALKKDKILKRGSDLSKVFKGGRGVLATWDRGSDVEIGEKVRIDHRTYEVAGLLKYNPFSDDGSVRGNTTLITSSDTFIHMTGEVGYRLVMLRVDENFKDDDMAHIRRIAGDEGTVSDRRDQKTIGTYIAFMFFVYGFLIIIAIVSLLNMINSIRLSVSSRIKEYGIMRAIGMDTEQLAKMIRVEALTYALSGSVAGSLAGILCNRWLFFRLIERHFSYAVWEFPAILLLMTVGFVFAAVVLAVHRPVERMERMSITETINEL